MNGESMYRSWQVDPAWTMDRTPLSIGPSGWNRYLLNECMVELTMNQGGTAGKNLHVLVDFQQGRFFDVMQRRLK